MRDVVATRRTNGRRGRPRWTWANGVKKLQWKRERKTPEMLQLIIFIKSLVLAPLRWIAGCSRNRMDESNLFHLTTFFFFFHFNIFFFEQEWVENYFKSCKNNESALFETLFLWNMPQRCLISEFKWCVDKNEFNSWKKNWLNAQQRRMKLRPSLCESIDIWMAIFIEI